MFKVSGATVYPSEVQAALRASTASTPPSSPARPWPQRPRVGAAVVSTSGATREALRAGARELLSAFRSRRSGWSSPPPTTSPRRHRQGLATELRDLLIAAG